MLATALSVNAFIALFRIVDDLVERIDVTGRAARLATFQRIRYQVLLHVRTFFVEQRDGVVEMTNVLTAAALDALPHRTNTERRAG